MYVVIRIMHVLHNFSSCSVGVTISFNNSLYEVNENSTLVQPVLTLTNMIDCCSTVSVWINIIKITAKSKIALYLFAQTHLC